MTIIADTNDLDLPPGTRLRLRAAADELEAAAENIELARERRDAAIVEAIEAGTSRRDVARWARTSPANVDRILARH